MPERAVLPLRCKRASKVVPWEKENRSPLNKLREGTSLLTADAVISFRERKVTFMRQRSKSLQCGKSLFFARWVLPSLLAMPVIALMVATGCSSGSSLAEQVAGLPDVPATPTQVQRGRLLVATHDCAGCHNGGRNDPSDPNWLSGATDAFQIGSFAVYPSNLTPDTTAGLGRFSARQIFNALRYGLDPEETPDVVITSSIPGQGNFPATPHYLGPPMPWPAFRHLQDENLWAIVAYLKHGIKANPKSIPDSQAPPDFWASSYTPEAVGPFPYPAYPATGEAFNP